MSSITNGNGHPAQPVDEDQADAFRYELGTFNRENVLASGDRGDDFLRMRYQPRALSQPMRQAGGPENALLAGWKSKLASTSRLYPLLSLITAMIDFHITTTDRDLDAEKQDHLHDGQLFRLNRQARGEVIQPPQRNHHGPNGNMFGPPHVGRNQPALPQILNNPGQNVDPLALAKALQFKGSYSGGKGRGRVSTQNGQPNNFAPSGPAILGGYGSRGRGGHSPGGKNSTGPLGRLNPHADIHADQGLPSQRGVNRNKHSSTIRGNQVVQPMHCQPMVIMNNCGRNGGPVQQHMVQRMNGASFSNGTLIAPVMNRTNSSMSNTSRASSAMASNSSGAIFSTGRRPPPQTKAGKLATPDEFMAAVRDGGLSASKHAPKTREEPKAEKLPESGEKLMQAEENLLKAEERLLKAEEKQLKAKEAQRIARAQARAGLTGSKYAG